jgi:hypothetical protein
VSGVFPTTHFYSEGGTVIDTCVYSIVVALNNKNKKTNEELKEENNKKAWLSVVRDNNRRMPACATRAVGS